MDTWKYDTSQLTEFPRFEPEPTQSGVSTFLSKILKFPIFSANESIENSDGTPPEEKQHHDQPGLENTVENEDQKTEAASYAAEFEGRSLPNVLKRISSLVALGSKGGKKYADTELARYWMPDDVSRECYECAARFSALRRRHHCRVCGQIFCSRCCSQTVPGHIFGCSGGLRVCTYCCNVLLSFLRENDAAGDAAPDLRALQDNLQAKFPVSASQANPTSARFVFAREQHDRHEPRAEHLRELAASLMRSLPAVSHRYRLVRYSGVWRGCDIIQWLVDNTHYKTRAQANQLCQALIGAGYMECVTEVRQFADYALYRPVSHALDEPEEDAPQECPRLVESVSSYCLDLNVDNTSARLIKAVKTESKASPTSEDEHLPIMTQEGAEPRHLCRHLAEAGSEHLRLLLRQCLARHALPACLLHVLLPLCTRAADIIHLDMYEQDMDVRNYVQVKKVPGGTYADCTLIHGVVISKNLAHKNMPQEILNPTVLLLDCSVAYQRVEGKLTSLEPMLMQERSYLARVSARLAGLGARVVLAAGGVARGAGGAAGVALAARVPRAALRRARRVLGAAPAPALHGLAAELEPDAAPPRLGHAAKFYVRNYSGKTLMVLEGCAKPNLGCCILLRGGSLQELIRMKKVVKFMLLACYNWKLEKAFLGDIGASLPDPNMEFDETEAETTEKIDSKVSEEVSADKNDFNTVEDSKEDKVDGNVVSEMKNEGSEEANKKNTEIDDPLQRNKFRRPDSDKNPTRGVPIKDFSDPLHSTLSADDNVFFPKEEETLKADSHTERWSTDDMVLSMSPNVVIPAPFWESEASKKSSLRAYFPHPKPRPAPRPPNTPRNTQRKNSRPQQTHVLFKELHPFIEMPITAPADDAALKAALANFRATGGRLVNDRHKPECPLHRPCVVKKAPTPEEPDKQTDEALDPLDPENHQRVSVLLYSYSDKSPNMPDFCVSPWIVTMELYGRHDISLGAFLEKYCFNSEYKCPSTNCQIPMNQHVRRFVFDDVCVTITCTTVGHSNVDKPSEEKAKQVSHWSRCGVCGARGGGVLSARALRLSLAGWLLPPPRTPACRHRAPPAQRAFLNNHTTALFRYNKITTYDVKFPPETISTHYEPKRMREQLINQLNELMLRGHETLSSVSDADADKDYQAFKTHTDHIHLALTSAQLHEHTTLPAIVRSLWSVSDRITLGEKMLRDAQDKWSSLAAKPAKHADLNVEDKSDAEDTVESDGSGTTYVFGDNSSKEIEKEHAGPEEDEEKGDKKTVRQILSQLLSNNQPANQGGMVIATGAVPVAVRAGALGSVIATALASAAYCRGLRALRSSQSESEENETTNSGKEKTDTEKEKDKQKTKPNEHIEVMLRDGLVCRVYYAAMFDSLRHELLAPLERAPQPCCPARKGLCDTEEGFVRSLSHCVAWAARGGKSGSTFCKTEDDRYVLKEMTKPEWQQFLEFAPHYYNYVVSSRQQQLPSLLARIVGVYSVGGGSAAAGILVMENVWYGGGGDAFGERYDLKGSSRPRFMAATSPVLMDHNLLAKRMDKPLYVSSAVGSVVWAALQRDTSFLASHHVMDYSLLCGVDEDSRTLVLGIIDYIRTFTWDKKLEHLVKKNLGSGQPTVVSPEQYKRRFVAACKKYFLQCPSHWDHFYEVIHA